MRILSLVLMSVASFAGAADRTVRTEVVVEAPAAEVWKAFTTKEGAESWMVPLAEIDLRNGGTMKTNYDKAAGIGGPGTIVHHILAYEPERMFAARFDVPESAAKLKLAEQTWYVVRFEPIGDARTRVTETMMGLGEGPEWDVIHSHFEKGNKWTLDKLAARFAKPGEATPQASIPAIDCTPFVASGAELKGLVRERDIAAPPAAVFKTYTTAEGWKAFLGADARIDLRIGGRFEILFGSEAPEGSRGSEGCRVLGYVPNESITYSWNAPPKFATVRPKRSWVQVTFRDNGAGGTRMRAVHTGFGEGEEWDQVYAYFDGAWDYVLEMMEDHYSRKAP